MVIPFPELPSRIPDVSPQVERNLWFIRIIVWSLFLSCIGRFLSMDIIGAMNDAFSFCFGFCLLGEKVFFGFKGCCENCLEVISAWAGFSCLWPFCIICFVNAVFDTFQLPQIDNSCIAYMSNKTDDTFQMATCSRFLFILSATILQFLGCYLGWDIYQEVRHIPSIAALNNPFYVPPGQGFSQYAEISRDPERGFLGPRQSQEFRPFQGQAHHLDDDTPSLKDGRNNNPTFHNTNNDNTPDIGTTLPGNASSHNSGNNPEATV